MKSKDFIKNNNLEKLSEKDLEKIFKCHKNGIIDGRNIIVEHNIDRLIKTIENNFKYYKDKDELIEVGAIALVEYVDSINSDSYAYFKKRFYEHIKNKLDLFIKNDETSNYSDVVDPLDPSDIVDNYINKCNIEKVNDLLNNIDPKRKKIIEMHYGFYGNKYTIKEIAYIFNTSATSVYKMIESTLFELKQGLMSRTVESTNTDHYFEGILSKFSYIKRKVVCSYFGFDTEKKDARSIAEEIGITRQYVYEIVKEYNQKVADKKAGKAPTTIKGIILDEFNKDPEKCNNFLKLLPVKSANIINSYFGFNGHERLSSNEIFNKYGITRKQLDNVFRNYKILLNVVNYEDTIQYKIENNIDTVNIVLSSLPGIAQNVIMLYYGIDCERCDSKDIVDNLGISKSYIPLALRKFKYKFNRSITDKMYKESLRKHINETVYCNFLSKLDTEEFQMLLYKLPLEDCISLRIRVERENLNNSKIDSFMKELKSYGITFKKENYAEDVKLLTNLINYNKNHKNKRIIKNN